MRLPISIAAAAVPHRIAAPERLVSNRLAARSATEQFSGTWALVSWKIEQAGGALVDSPLGADPRGWIMYDSAGHMSVVLMRLDRPTFASNNLMDATPEEVAAAFAGYVSYCGSYEVNEQERFVIHRIELSWFPNLIGTEQKRFFAFAGDRLTLETPPLTLLGDAQIHCLVWQRLPGGVSLDQPDVGAR
jgi:lipocalin-like protein